MFIRFYNKTPLLLVLTLTTAWFMTTSQAFAPQSSTRIGRSSAPMLQQQQQSPACTPMARIRRQERAQSSLRVVADAEQDEKKRRKDSKNNSNDANDWTPTASGGFLPNLTQRFKGDTSTITEKPLMTEVTSLQDYKDHVVDYKDGLVCVRFFAPWCRACKAVQVHYRQLAKTHPNVKFVQVPLTKDNAFLHTGLGVPSLPFAHIYHPSAGLVEERSINKKVFGDFKKVLQTYVDRECSLGWDEQENPVHQDPLQ